MSAGPRWSHRAVFGLVWLLLFSALYTAGDAFGLWPEMPPGFLQDADLVVGGLGAAVLCLWLLRGRRESRVESRGSGAGPSETLDSRP